TKQEVRDKLRSLHDELSRSVRSSRRYTIAQAVDDWLADGMDGRSAATVAKYRHVLAPVLAELGNRVLTDLTAGEVKAALSRYAATHATETASIARLGLERAIRHAEANGLVGRNVAALVHTPKGRTGRPSKALDAAQAAAVLRASRQDRAMGEFPGCPPRPPALMQAYRVL